MSLRTYIDKNENIIIGLIMLFLLVWLAPNLFHEPIHYFTLKAQGIDGFITFDFSFPSAPSTTRLGEISLIGGLFYLLAPSIASVCILLFLAFRKVQPTLLTHVVLPAYLAFDLIMNIFGQQSPTSDFRFLSVLPQYVTTISVVLILLLAAYIVIPAIIDEQQEKEHGHTMQEM